MLKFNIPFYTLPRVPQFLSPDIRAHALPEGRIVITHPHSGSMNFESHAAALAACRRWEWWADRDFAPLYSPRGYAKKTYKDDYWHVNLDDWQKVFADGCTYYDENRIRLQSGKKLVQKIHDTVGFIPYYKHRETGVMVPASKFQDLGPHDYN